MTEPITRADIEKMFPTFLYANIPMILYGTRVSAVVDEVWPVIEQLQEGLKEYKMAAGAEAQLVDEAQQRNSELLPLVRDLLKSWFAIGDYSGNGRRCVGCLSKETPELTDFPEFNAAWDAFSDAIEQARKLVEKEP